MIPKITILRSDDHCKLDQIVQNHNPNTPICNEQGKRIGTIARVWRDGVLLVGEIKLDRPLNPERKDP